MEETQRQTMPKKDSSSADISNEETLLEQSEDSLDEFALKKRRELAMQREQVLAQQVVADMQKKQAQALAATPSLWGEAGLFGSKETLSNLVDEVEKADGDGLHSSQEFKEMKQSLKTLHQEAFAAPANLTQEQRQRLGDCYRDLRQKSAACLHESGMDSRAALRAHLAAQAHALASQCLHAMEAQEKLDDKAFYQAKMAQLQPHRNSYAEQLNAFRQEKQMYASAQQAQQAHTQLCQAAAKRTLGPEEELQMLRQVAKLLIFEQLRAERKCAYAPGEFGPIETFLRKRTGDGLDLLAEQLMSEPAFARAVPKATARFAEKLVTGDGIRLLNKALSNHREDMNHEEKMAVLRAAQQELMKEKPAKPAPIKPSPPMRR